MATNPFEETKIERENKSAPKSLMETAGYVISAAILLVVIVVMTTDIRNITLQSVADLSLQMFVLMFLSYGMYVSMYQNGMMAGEKLPLYISVTNRYNQIRDEIASDNNHQALSSFCRGYVEQELKSRIEDLILVWGITYEQYEKIRFLSRNKLAEQGLSKGQIRCVRKANRIRPIKLTPEMLCKQGKAPIKRGVMHIQPAIRRKKDYVKKFFTTSLTSCAMGFIAFELFSEPTWETVCAVVFKLFMVAITGYSGYMRGYDNIVTDSVLYMQDQIDLLGQFKRWKDETSKHHSSDEE
jgi:hypothetical protein